MSKQMPYMVLDLTKKPGDEDAVKTGDMLLAENERMRKALRETVRLLAAWKVEMPYRIWAEVDDAIRMAQSALSEEQEGGAE